MNKSLNIVQFLCETKDFASSLNKNCEKIVQMDYLYNKNYVDFNLIKSFRQKVISTEEIKSFRFIE